MKIFRKILIAMLGIAMLGAGTAAIGIAADTVKITGVINDDGQLVENSGQVYIISEEGAGSDAMEYSGEKMTVDGTVMEEDGEKVIVIRSFDLVQ